MTSRPSRSSPAVGDHGDGQHRGQAVGGERAEQPVLAEGEVVGQLLGDVRGPPGPVTQLDEPDLVTVQAEHAAHVRQVPVGEVGGERQRADVGMVGRVGQLQPHARPILLDGIPANLGS